MEYTLFAAKTDTYRALADAALAEFLLDIPQPIVSAIKYSVFAGGKRLRPCLTFAAWELMEGEGSIEEQRVFTVRPLAAAIEMIHTYSLIHDDLPCMDNDDYRRGKLTNHKVYGEATAVLCGDALLNYAYELMFNAAIVYGKALPKYLDACFTIAQSAGAFGMIDGQIQDLQNEHNDDAGYDELKALHAKKTGELIRAAVLSGALASKKIPTTQHLNALTVFSNEFGMLFQITDDILDVCGDAALVGKTLGKDEKSDKLTYPKLFGVERSRELAEETAQRAIAALAPFGDAAWYFVELTKHTLLRDK